MHPQRKLPSRGSALPARPSPLNPFFTPPTPAGAPHNIDESWGLYAGGADKNCGLLARVMAMSKQFGGMRDAADGKCER